MEQKKEQFLPKNTQAKKLVLILIETPLQRYSLCYRDCGKIS
jgi:hypothetical protein